jgi:DNA-directed RNA polymerase subunit beta'
MPHVAIPSNLKNIESISLSIMSPEMMEDMSYGEVISPETINYRTGQPSKDGLFCQAIFGPVVDWCCQCGKYKRYRYANIICDRCGVEVTSSSVRRERMGHITLAAPCVHPWYLRSVPSRIAVALDMKAVDIEKVVYFSAYIVTEVNETMRAEYLDKIDREADGRIKQTKNEFDKKIDDLSRQYQKDKSAAKADTSDVKAKYEADKEIIRVQEQEILTRIETIRDLAKKELQVMKLKDVMTEPVYRELSQKFAPVFKAGIGAEAIDNLLSNIDLTAEIETVTEAMHESKGQTYKKIAKRLRLLKNFQKNDIRPEWMILKKVMVLPPDLRPMLQLDGGRFAASDLNELYRKLINRNNRLRKLIEIGAPEVMLRNEKRMLQESVEALVDNSARSGRQVMTNTGNKRVLKSITDLLKGKQGRFRQNLLGKRVDYSGRSVIIIGPNLKLNQCGIPKKMALELFKPFLIGRIISMSESALLEEYKAVNVHSARRLIELELPIVFDILEEIVKENCVLLNRAPTLHRLSFLAFEPVLIEGKAIQLHPLVCKAFNADFDGDQMQVHLPITQKAQEEARNIMLATKNLLKPADGSLIMGGHQDIHLGAYYLTSLEKNESGQLTDGTTDKSKLKYFGSESEAVLAYENKKIGLRQPIKIKMREKTDVENQILETSVGRVLYNRNFPTEVKFYNEVLNKKRLGGLLVEVYFEVGQEELSKILDRLKDISYKYATSSGISLSAYDLIEPTGRTEVIEVAKEKVFQINAQYQTGLMTEQERYSLIISTWKEVENILSEMAKQELDIESNVGIMITSGGRGDIIQLKQIVGMKGLLITATGHVIELPALNGYRTGLNGLEYFNSARGQRKSLADISLKTADAGYMTRRLVDVAQNIIVNEYDCFTEEGIVMTEENSKEIGKTLRDRAYGRYLAGDAVDKKGKILAKAGELLDRNLLNTLMEAELETLFVRSPSKCSLTRGICQKCVGMDFSSHQPVELGTAVGVIAAQSIGEPGTQLTMHSKHFGGVATRTDITSGLPRVEELFEAREPKVTASISEMSGVVEEVTQEGLQFTVKVASKSTTVMSQQLSEGGLSTLVENGVIIKTGEPIISKSNGEVISSMGSGRIELSDKQLIISTPALETQEYKLPLGSGCVVKKGQKISLGQPLSDGPVSLQQLMALVGMDGVQNYIIGQLNDIYTSNGQNINEKHIEVIIRQMFSRVQIIEPGDSELTNGDILSIATITEINKKLRSLNQKQATYKRILTGITRASLSTDSFLAAASFQETTRVLIEAVLSGRKDYLRGLKENVILGQLIPAGTGFRYKPVQEDEFLYSEFDDSSEDMAIVGARSETNILDDNGENLE